MRTIEIDEQVYLWLQAQAKPFQDSPNSVLRRIAGLGLRETGRKRGEDPARVAGPPRGPTIRTERLTGEGLRREWRVPVKHALYHRAGTFYENLKRFPGGLFDLNGYVVFETEAEYHRCDFLRIGAKLNVPGGISSLRGYVRKRG